MSEHVERWASLPGWEGLYEVSNLGRILSLDRVVNGPHGLQRVRGRVLKHRIVGPRANYHAVSLARDGKAVPVGVHRLVLMAFVGLPKPGQEARHLNGNPSDNRLTNLAWGTRVENASDRGVHGTALFGERNPAAKLTDEQVRLVRQLLTQGLTHRAIAAVVGCSAGHISRIRNGEQRRTP